MCNLWAYHRTRAPGARAQRTAKALRGWLLSNERQATANRALLDRHGVYCINLMSAAGAGKTGLLESTLAALHHHLRMAALVADSATDSDLERIRAQRVVALRIACGHDGHLDARAVRQCLAALELAALDLVFIENIGNPVCPPFLDLGQHRNVALLSAPEGDDKPSKYPALYGAADLVLVTKADLLPLLDDFRLARVEASLRQLGSNAALLALSAKTGNGLDAWLGWLRHTVNGPRVVPLENA